MEYTPEAPIRRQATHRQDLVRPLLTLILGAVAGAIAAVMFMTLDPEGSSPPPPPSGGGNARYSLDSDALQKMITDKLGVDFGTVLTDVQVEERGVLTITMRSVEAPAGLDGRIVVDPNIDAETGDLLLDVSEQQGVFPEGIVGELEQALQDRLVALAGGKPYRVTAITTTGNRLGLEILA